MESFSSIPSPNRYTSNQPYVPITSGIDWYVTRHLDLIGDSQLGYPDCPDRQSWYNYSVTYTRCRYLPLIKLTVRIKVHYGLTPTLDSHKTGVVRFVDFFCRPTL